MQLIVVFGSAEESFRHLSETFYVSFFTLVFRISPPQARFFDRFFGAFQSFLTVFFSYKKNFKISRPSGAIFTFYWHNFNPDVTCKVKLLFNQLNRATQASRFVALSKSQLGVIALNACKRAIRYQLFVSAWAFFRAIVSPLCRKTFAPIVTIWYRYRELHWYCAGEKATGRMKAT